MMRRLAAAAPTGPWLLAAVLVGAALAQHSVLLDGELILGGLFPVHERGEHAPCGPKLYNRGLQRLEAMLFAVDRINSDDSLLPDIPIGVNILDTCSTDTYALNQSLEFIRTSLDVMDTVSFECADLSTPQPKYRSKPVSGVVGASYSTISINAANLFRLFRIPQISPASTAQSLSDKSRFEFFARTVPPDTFQATALVDVVQLFNWSYVSTVASEGSYGESGIDAFQRQAVERNICIAVLEKVPRDAVAKHFEAIILSLKKKPMARAVVLFVRAEDARGILMAAKRMMLSERFFWIASDGWGKQDNLVQGLEDVAQGAITVELSSKHIPEFDNYMASLTPFNNRRNPWFKEYWETLFQCELDVSAEVPCDPKLRLLPKYGFVQESKVQFVIDAVYAYAHALQSLHRDVCPGHRDVCMAMRKYDGGQFYNNYILNVSFTDMADSKVMFDERGDGLARYTIFNYQRSRDGQGAYTVIGSWDGGLHLDPADVQWHGADEPQTTPLSVCALPCRVGEVKRMQQVSDVVWPGRPSGLGWRECERKGYGLDLSPRAGTRWAVWSQLVNYDRGEPPYISAGRRLGRAGRGSHVPSGGRLR
ncbi:metabotropic glutamate receptor-like [Amphibalanus amphitrite]|uniref:metabotropic glutamate receptor-like n=1 Tax=Amphibalanus amphitrite TaxID=1232801 RepID=UPI001C918766|nr:metabotropic glutamate receptor-like [Amphibalanus amphitrite]